MLRRRTFLERLFHLAMYGPPEDWQGIADQLRAEGYEQVDRYFLPTAAREEIDAVCRQRERMKPPTTSSASVSDYRAFG